ncbi:MAG: aminopeptidase P family protein [Chloroflexota bacterium]
MSNRLKQLRDLLPERELDAILISQPANRRYLSGFTGSDGYLLISQDNAILATDFRYREQSREQAPHFSTFEIKSASGGSDWFPQLIAETGVKRLGLESDGLTLAEYHQLVKAARKLSPKSRPRLLPAQGTVESLRAIKDKEELDSMRKAAALADTAEEHARSVLRRGMTEKELAWGLERFMREKGSESIPFDIIVASGPNSALPHAQPSERPIQEGEPVVIDLGARVNGYCSDMTRTIWVDEPNDMLKTIYNIVYEAQRAAIKGVRAGMSADEADRLARNVITDAGYGEAFGHSLGHGVGLDPHEQPRLGPNSQDTLADGMVFTIEPGVYVEGWGGVRIEDMILLEEGKPQSLTKASKLKIQGEQ